MKTAAEVTAFPVRDMTGLRASELARCPRMCALRHTAEPREPSPIERRYFARGNMYGRFVAEQLALRYGPENVEFEKAIPWEHGEAHVDVYVKSENLFVEVLSTTSPSTLTLGMKIQQVKIYGRLWERAGHETPALQVYVVNPGVLTREEAFPVELTDDDRGQIDTWITEIGAAVEHGETLLPARVCSKPSDGRARLCPFIDPCFEGWLPPSIPSLDDDAEVVALAKIHHDLAEQERTSRKAADSLRDQRKEIEARLADRVEPGEHHAAGYVIRRTHVTPREKFDIARARKAGRWTAAHDEIFGPFVSLVGEHDRWSVRRQDGDILAPELGTLDDYGDVPF